jgi:uncharacterized protein
MHDPNIPATAADGDTHPLDPRWIPYRRRVAWATAALFALLVSAAAVVAVVVLELPMTPVIAAATLLVGARTAVGLWWPTVSYRHAGYRLSERALEIRRGVIWRSVIDVPRSRIQHSDVSQGPLERAFGLGTLSVYTAGTAHSLVRLAGLDHGRALAIREHLLQPDVDDVI